MESYINIPLLTALAAIGLAQLIKIPLYYIPNKSWNWSLMFSTGGMPSSHSAAMTALATSIGLEYGLHSPLFAIAVVFGMIVMFDAAGVRRHAGEQAVVLNRLVEDVNLLVKEMKNWKGQTEQGKRNKLKELLGHQPIEVMVGAVFGIVFAFVVHYVLDVLEVL